MPLRVVPSRCCGTLAADAASPWGVRDGAGFFYNVGTATTGGGVDVAAVPVRAPVPPSAQDETAAREEARRVL